MRLPTALASIAGAALLTAPAFAGKFNAVLEIGDRLPGFEVLPTTAGGTLSSADLTENVIVLVSLANHCPWVRGGDADLVALVDGLEGDSVRVVGFAVNHREDDRLAAMKRHAEKAGYNFTYVFDESQEIGRRLGATRTPEYFVFDRDRRLVYMGLLHDSPARMLSDGSVRYTNGAPTKHYALDAIEAILSGSMPKVTETRAHGCTVEYQR